MSIQTDEVAADLSRLVDKAPAGGIFTTVTLGEVKSLWNGIVKAPAQSSFDIFIRAGEQFRVTVERI